MKILGFILINLFTINSIAGNDNRIEVRGSFENAEGKTIYLSTFVKNSQIKLDSMIIKKNGKFKMEANVKEPGFYTLSFGEREFILLALYESDITGGVEVIGDRFEMQKSYTVSGSPNSELIQQYFSSMGNYQDKKKELNGQLYAKGIDKEKREVLKLKIDSLDQTFISERNKFIVNNKKSIAVLTAVGSLNPNTDIEYFKMVEKGLGESVPGTEYHIAIQTQVKQLETQIRLKKEQEAERERLAKMTQIGAEAQELNMKNPEGELITIESLRGKYVLLDFWASWCRPCRMENPNVVKMFNKYQEKGFTVMSISLDTDANRWKAAIQQDGLIWPNHVSDLKGWKTEAVKKYGFKGIPFTVLLDPEGKIVAKNLRGLALEQKLAELFPK